MEYEKYDVIVLENAEKLIVLETIEYDGKKYLYVDKLNYDETDTLKKYHILRVCDNDTIQKETDTNVLTNILPLFSKNIKLDNE